MIVEELEFRYKVQELQFTDIEQENWVLQIESIRTGVYRQKVGDLEFTDRKLRTGVCRQKLGKSQILQIESMRTVVYRQKMGELEFTDRK